MALAGRRMAPGETHEWPVTVVLNSAETITTTAKVDYQQIARDTIRSHGGNVTLGESDLGGLSARIRIPV